jgi:hypothetical protein
MSRHLALLVILLAGAASIASGLTFEVGAMGSGGLTFSSGSWFDAKAAALAELGGSSLTTDGSSTVKLFPEYSGGAFAEVEFIPWLAARVEARYAFLGAARVALTEAGAAFDTYGLYFSSLLVPVTARGKLPVGPGKLTATAGPFIGIVLGDIVVVDTYADSSTSAGFPAASGDAFFAGLTGGIGYEMPLGPGIASIELRADWAFTSIGADRLAADVTAVGATLMAGYGIRIGGK